MHRKRNQLMKKGRKGKRECKERRIKGTSEGIKEKGKME